MAIVAATDEAAEFADRARPARRRGGPEPVATSALAVGGTYLVPGLSDGRHTPADTAGLAGTVWRLVGYGNQRDRNSDATFYIDKNGALAADDACTVIGARASAGRPAPHHEGRVLAGKVTWSTSKEELKIRKGGTALTFER